MVKWIDTRYCQIFVDLIDSIDSRSIAILLPFEGFSCLSGLVLPCAPLVVNPAIHAIIESSASVQPQFQLGNRPLQHSQQMVFRQGNSFFSFFSDLDLSLSSFSSFSRWLVLQLVFAV